MKLHAFRLRDGEDLYKAIASYAKSNDIKAGFIVGGVAGLKALQLRLPETPEEQPSLHKNGKYELVSITGTVGVDGLHVHVSAANEKGLVVGGHLMKEGNIVRNTAEIGILETSDMIFSGEMDETTGWKELVIKHHD